MLFPYTPHDSKAAGDVVSRVDIRKAWRAALDRNGTPQKITVSDTPDA